MLLMNYLRRLRGDKTIWVLFGILSFFSLIAVYSSSTNLAYTVSGGSPASYLVKHFVHICLGLLSMYWIHRVPYHYWRKLSYLLLPFFGVLLVYTLFKGTQISGANASRWIQIPLVGISFQTSTFAFVCLMIYVAGYLTKTREEPITLKHSLLYLWLPVFATMALILPANFSTTAIMFSMVLMLVYIGNYPLKQLFTVLGFGLVLLLLFVLIAKAFPNKLTSRVDTWQSRIEKFVKNDVQEEEQYQVERAKTAIATGGFSGLGPGKSVQRNFLPQSSSDFIYAIVVEEYGLVGAITLLAVYLLLFVRFLLAAHKARTAFGKLLVIGLGFPIIFQALINMGVAVNLLPVTGQPLPLISAGGSSIWAACIALGIILNVTKKDEELAEEEKENKLREEALQRLIDKQLEEEKLESEVNPMQPILKQSK